MNLSISCQACGKILAVVEKDQVTQDDIIMYEAGAFCQTIAGETVDSDGNSIPVYDGQTNIQATMIKE